MRRTRASEFTFVYSPLPDGTWPTKSLGSFGKKAKTAMEWMDPEDIDALHLLDAVELYRRLLEKDSVDAVRRAGATTAPQS